jgi:hypothetical protein
MFWNDLAVDVTVQMNTTQLWLQALKAMAPKMTARMALSGRGKSMTLNVTVEE